MMRNIAFASLAFILSVASYAQVSSVKYGLEYNSTTCLFDAYVTIEEGAARSIKERLQLNAQFSIIAPQGSDVVIEEVYQPFQDNQRYRSSTPIDWFVASEAESLIDGTPKKLFGIAPQIAPAAFYNDVYEGDKVVLFSMSISPMVNCGSDVTLYDESVHPSSAEAGLEGGDFRQGFTMGGINQLYQGNHEVVKPQAPKVSNLKGEFVNGRSIVTFDLDDSSTAECQNKLDYRWEGPNGFNIKGDLFPQLTEKEIRKGDYYLVVSDQIGCTTRSKVDFGLQNTIGNEIGNGVESVSEADKSATIFPNPTKDVLNIHFNANKGDHVKASIVDQSGKVVMLNVIDETLKENGATIVKSISVASGLYNLDVWINNRQAETQKVIVVQ